MPTLPLNGPGPGPNSHINPKLLYTIEKVTVST